jgi:hypothetical protein
MTAYNKFYELKSRYDSQFSNFKQKLTKKKNISIVERSVAVEKYKEERKCVKCDKMGGTNFEITKNYLKATCNVDSNLDTPCDLHIEIFKGDEIHYKDETHDVYEKKLNTIKRDITKTKLKLLFNLEKEDILLKDFEDNKNELILLTGEFNEIQKYYDGLDKINIEVNKNINELEKLNEIDEGDEGDEGDEENKTEYKENNKEKTIKREHMIKTHEKDLNKYITEYKNILKKYNTLDDDNVLKRAMEKYISEIKPVQEKIRNAKYSTIYIEEIEIDNKDPPKLPIFHFKQNRKDVNDLVTPRKKNKVISYKV